MRIKELLEIIAKLPEETEISLHVDFPNGSSLIADFSGACTTLEALGEEAITAGLKNNLSISGKCRRNYILESKVKKDLQ